MHNRRHTTSYRPAPIFSTEQQEELRAELATAAARNQHWQTHQVAAWMSELLGRPVSYGSSWRLEVPTRHVIPLELGH